MRLRLFSISAALICYVLCLLAPAANALSYFAAEVPVTSQTASDRKQATADALEKVLIRVSGVTDLPQSSAIAQAKRSPDSLVDQYSFRANPELDVSAQLLSVSFSPAGIQNLLSQAGLPFWPLNRPSVLLWLAEDDASEGRRLVTDPENPVLKGLMAVANLRGLPLTLPLLDLEDQMAIGPNEVWQLDEEAVATASQRYNADTVLVGKYSVTSTGAILSSWQYVHRATRRNLDFRTQDLQLTGSKAINALADHLAGLYAVRAGESVGSSAYLVEVNQILDYQDFDAMLSYLKALALVDQLQLNRTMEDKVYLNMTLKGDQSQLENALALDGRVRVLPTVFQQSFAPQRSTPVSAVAESENGEETSVSPADGEVGAVGDALASASTTPVLPQPVLPTLRFEWIR